MSLIQHLFPKTDKAYESIDLNQFVEAFSGHLVLVLTDTQGVILEANDHFCELSQYSRDELVCKSGKQIPVSLTVTPIKNPSGTIIGYLGVGRDLREYKSLLSKITESKRRFQGAFQQSGIGMAIVSLEGKWVEVNPSVCRIVGYPADELMHHRSGSTGGAIGGIC